MKWKVKRSTQTGDMNGLENDSQNLKTVLHRLLLPEAGRAEPAKKMNQWLIVSFGVTGMDTWVGPFYFNDGNLSEATISNQFLFVVTGLESIGCQVLGVLMDAGGCNARFVEEFFPSLKKMGYGSWLEVEDCCCTNFWSLNRKIFVWFCITHLMKAFRNTLEGSQPGGPRALEDKNDVLFGWAFTFNCS